MDLEKRARRQGLRVIVSETIMVLAVAAMVIVLALVVSGYWINANFEVERQGMLQVYSVPTGASVEVDGDAPWFQRTNTSKILTSGEHKITLTKDGYDSWSKTINISEGLLYRLHYPRLFLRERDREEIYDATLSTSATVSPNRRLILLLNNTTTWTLLNIDSDNPKPTTINIANLFSSTSLADGATNGLFVGDIISAEWDQANEHILFKVKNNTSTEWVLLDVKNPINSVNITREFAADFDNIKIFDNSADNLLSLRNGNLHKINIPSRQISAILVEGVQNYDFYESELVFSSEESISSLKLGDNTPVVLKKIESPARVLVSKFYETNYIFIVEGNTLSVYQEENLEEVLTATLRFIPDKIKVGYGGEFIVMNSDSNFSTLDMESMTIHNWDTGSTNYGWIDNYMAYSVDNGVLSVYDFDGLNHRELANNVSSHFPVTITSDKWLYYFSDGKLLREWLIAR
ncbi:PEGA domain-containing protein [Candidatus Saccharibacteria bacterium]|nr:PEGA domain-containing protein [Candidatus Saccharibacteria bacterium]